MTITAELHDGTRLEFPDGTDQAVIDNVVKDHLSPKLLDVVNTAVNVGNSLTPLGLISYAQNFGNDVVKKERNYLGDKTLELTNSPAAATAAYMLPDVANLVAGNRVAAIAPKIAPGNELGKAASRLGFNPTWGQRANSPTLMQIEDTMRRMPGSGGVFARNDMANQSAVNRAVSKAIGQQSDTVSGEVLASATDDLGNARNALKSQVSIPKGEPTILQTISNATQELKTSLRNGGEWKNVTENIKNRLNAGAVDGKQYQTWRTDLKDYADAAYKAGKTKLGDAYRALRSSLDDVARGGASDAWKANDKAFSTLEMVQEGNVVNPVTGNVSAPLLANKFFQTFGKNAKQGKMPGEINDIATLQRGYPKWAEGSPTAKAEMYDSLVPWAASIPSAALAKLLTSDPYDLVRLGAYFPAASSGVSGLLESGQ